MHACSTLYRNCWIVLAARRGFPQLQFKTHPMCSAFAHAITESPNNAMPQVYIGIIDQGLQYVHPDLAANIWTNPDEVPGDGIDNDGNGKKTYFHRSTAVSPEQSLDGPRGG